MQTMHPRDGNENLCTDGSTPAQLREGDINTQKQQTPNSQFRSVKVGVMNDYYLRRSPRLGKKTSAAVASAEKET